MRNNGACFWSVPNSTPPSMWEVNEDQSVGLRGSPPPPIGYLRRAFPSGTMASGMLWAFTLPVRREGRECPPPQGGAWEPTCTLQ